MTPRGFCSHCRRIFTTRDGHVVWHLLCGTGHLCPGSLQPAANNR